jgi:5-methylcytosine-specific restriction endonuclease McrA
MESCELDFMTWLAKYGRSSCERVMKNWNRKRLDVVGRPARVKFPWSEYKRMYERQGGLCPLCQEIMPLIRGKIEMDHINPNLTGEEFNAKANRQVVCSGCNREKGALSVADQTKRYGRTMTQILITPEEDV